MLSAQELYDTLPVYYCKRCLSLRILQLEGMGDSDACYCDECNSTDIGQTSIEEWEEMYKDKYKKPFIKSIK